MPITPFLAHQAFDPETIETMSAAYVATCDALHLKVGDDPATRAVAEKVINLAQRWHSRCGCASHDDAEGIWFER